MSTLQFVAILIVITGHCAIWLTLFNRLGAQSQRWIRTAELLVFLILSVPLGWLAWCWVQGTSYHSLSDAPWWAQAYGWACVAELTWKTLGWAQQRRTRKRPPDSLMEADSRSINVAQHLGNFPAAGLGQMWRWAPGNESWRLDVERKTLWLPQFPQELAGLTVTHLSDLHFTGLVGREYFEFVVDEANALKSDFVFLTGDIADRQECLPWIKMLGRLEARCGVFFVLGNHDKRPGGERVRAELCRAGLTSLGSRSQLVEHQGRHLLLAGDERPWFGCDPDLSEWDLADARLLLAHTPDRYRWARRHGFDAMFAGHTHGGQIRVPVLGALVAPSIYGTRYASGVFDEPPTVLHVSRGVSGKHPIRWRCPPELTQLTLKCHRGALPVSDESCEAQSLEAKLGAEPEECARPLTTRQAAHPSGASAS